MTQRPSRAGDVLSFAFCEIGFGGSCSPGSRRQMGKNLLDKVWDLHAVRELPSGQTQLFIGLHLIHEVTSS